MSSDLDSRITQLQERRRANDKATEVSVSGLEDSVRQASRTLDELNAKTDIISQATHQLEAKLIVLRRTVSVGVALTLVAAIVVIAFALWTGARIRQAAMDQASTIQEQNAVEIEQIRQEGEQEIAATRTEMADQRARVELEVAEAGADLAGMASELQAGRAELQQFIALKERAGFNLLITGAGR